MSKPQRKTQAEYGRQGGKTPPADGKRRGLKKGAKLDKKPPPPRMPDAVLEAKKTGRPPKLQADESTIAMVEGLSGIGSTDEEIASMLNVSTATLYAFLKANKSVLEARERGGMKFRISIRRKQFSMADKNASILIWLGKQYLGQKDVVEVTNEDGPNRTEALASDRARALELAERLGLGSPAEDVGGGTQNAGARKLPGISEVN